MISTRKARAIARSQSAAPNQADVSAHPVSKKKRKRSRGCNKGEEAPTEMPKDNKRTLWIKFESTYVWDPVEDGAVYDARELYEATKESHSGVLTNIGSNFLLIGKVCKGE